MNTDRAEFHEYDLIVRRAVLVDGTGSPASPASLAVTGGRIAAVGDLAAAQGRVEVDADGLVLCPGFIDIHSHADLALLDDPLDTPKITQGVTTEVVGNCGLGFAPSSPASRVDLSQAFGALFPSGERVGWGWPSVSGYRAAIAGVRPAVNVVVQTPHAAVRSQVVGRSGRAASDWEIGQMADIVAACRDEGAAGLSTGLEYGPMCEATEYEVSRLAAVAGRLSIHQRSYGPSLFEATTETISIARTSGVPVQLSHLQTSGPANSGRAEELLNLIDQGCADGADLAFDSYPYCAGATVVHAMMPAWCKGDGFGGILAALAAPALRYRIMQELDQMGRDWSRTVLLATAGAGFAYSVGNTFQEIAAAQDIEPTELVCRLVEDGLGTACYLVHHMEERDLATIMCHRRQCFGSDGLFLVRGGHPRLWGTFTRALGRYARDLGLLSLEDAVRRMTSMPAARLGLTDRGRLAPGYAADLVLFRPGSVADRATYDEPTTRSAGIAGVWTNGVRVVDEKGVTGMRGGAVL